MKHVYISSCRRDGGIYHFTFEGGRLELREKTDVDRPLYSVISEGKMYVLTRKYGENTENGALVTFCIANDGSLTDRHAALDTKGALPCHLAVEGEEVYAVNYDSGSIVLFPDKVVTHTGKGTNTARQEAPHTHFVGLTPDKKYVLCTDLGTDTVFVYDRALNEVSRAEVPAGSGCRHLCVTNDLVYCLNELSSDVSVFSFRDGRLSPLGTYTAIPGFGGETYAAAIRMYEGRLYVSHRGADCISCFDIEGKGLRLRWNADCGGRSPHDFDIIDGYIVCANDGGSVTVLRPDDAGAKLVSSAEVPRPVCVTSL